MRTATLGPLRQFFVERPDVWKFAFFILVSPLSFQHLLKPACEAPGPDGSQLTLPGDSPFVKDYPCDGTTAARVCYIYRRLHVVYPLFYRIRRRDFWVTVAHLWLLVRLAASAALPPGLYLHVFAPVLNVCQRLLPAAFLLGLSLVHPGERPSALGLWFLRVVPLMDVVSLRFHQSGFCLEAAYGMISFVALVVLGRHYARTRVELGLPLPVMLACRVVSTAIVLIVEARRSTAARRVRQARQAQALKAKLVALGADADAGEAHRGVDGDEGYRATSLKGAQPGKGPGRHQQQAQDQPLEKQEPQEQQEQCCPQEEKVEELQQRQRQQRQERGGLWHQVAEAKAEVEAGAAAVVRPAASTRPLTHIAGGGAAMANGAERRPTYQLYDSGSAAANASLRAPLPALAPPQRLHRLRHGQPGQLLQLLQPPAQCRTQANSPPQRGLQAPPQDMPGADILRRTGAVAYKPCARFTTTAIKIRGVDPEDLAPGYEERIAQVLAARGLELEAVYVRRGCIEMVIDARLWARARASGNSDMGCHLSAVAESLSVSGELEEVLEPRDAACLSADTAPAGGGGGASTPHPAAAAGEGEGLSFALPPRSPLSRSSGEGSGGSPDGSVTDVDLIIRSLWLSHDVDVEVDVQSESGPLSCLTSASRCRQGPAVLQDALAAAAATSTHGDNTTDGPDNSEGPSPIDAGPIPPHPPHPPPLAPSTALPTACGSRRGAARPPAEAAAVSRPPPAITALSPRVLVRGPRATAAVAAAHEAAAPLPEAGELCLSLQLIVDSEDCLAEILVRSRGRYLPAQAKCCQVFAVTAVAEAPEAAGPVEGSNPDGACASDLGEPVARVAEYVVTLPVASLPTRPGLLVVEARRAEQLRGAAVPVLVLDDPWVASEVQAMAECWQRPPEELQDILMDLACFAHHASVAAEQWPASQAEQPPPQPPTLPRVRSLGLHLLGFMSGQDSWPLTVAWIQESLLALGTEAAAVYGASEAVAAAGVVPAAAVIAAETCSTAFFGAAAASADAAEAGTAAAAAAAGSLVSVGSNGAASAAGIAIAAFAVPGAGPETSEVGNAAAAAATPLLSAPGRASGVATGGAGREVAPSACPGLGDPAAGGFSVRRRQKPAPPPPSPLLSSPTAALPAGDCRSGACVAGGVSGGWGGSLRSTLALLAAPMDEEYESFVAEFCAGTAHLNNIIIFLVVASACMRPALQNMFIHRQQLQGLHYHNQQPNATPQPTGGGWGLCTAAAGLPTPTASATLLQAAPFMIACVPYMVAAVGWALLPRPRWVRCVKALVVWRPLSEAAAELLMVVVEGARSPPHAAYHHGFAVWVGNGLVCPATALVPPRTALILAVLRLPIDACLWLALGAPYGTAWAFARATALAAMYLVVNGVSNWLLRAGHRRQQARLRRPLSAVSVATAEGAATAAAKEEGVTAGPWGGAVSHIRERTPASFAVPPVPQMLAASAGRALG